MTQEITKLRRSISIEIFIQGGGILAKLKWHLGKVRWFDSSKGFGFVRDNEGNSIYVHYSAIESSKKIKNLKDSAPVKFQIHEDANFKQVSKIKEVA